MCWTYTIYHYCDEKVKWELTIRINGQREIEKKRKREEWDEKIRGDPYISPQSLSPNPPPLHTTTTSEGLGGGLMGTCLSICIRPSVCLCMCVFVSGDLYVRLHFPRCAFGYSWKLTIFQISQWFTSDKWLSLKGTAINCLQLVINTSTTFATFASDAQRSC